MQKLKNNKIATISFITILMVSLGGSTMLLPATNAHTPPWTITSHAFMTISPDPIGKGQAESVAMWVDEPLAGALLTNNIRRDSYTLTITAPNGEVTTKQWAVVSDSTGIQSYQFTPNQIGNYTIKFDYAGQTYTWNQANTPGLDSYSASFYNDILTPASTTMTLTVQQQPAPSVPSYGPLPTAYWTRPIFMMNSDWYQVSSNWLGEPYVPGAGESYPQNGFLPPEGPAPSSAHVLWTKSVQYGGVVGGNDTNVAGEGYYTGNSYECEFVNPIIMQGTLFYQEPYGNGQGTGGNYDAVNLQTGQTIWSINPSATGISLVPSFGYIYTLDNPDQDGALSLLIAPYTVGSWGNQITCWAAYDPLNGELTTMNITNVPSGVEVAGPAGELLIETLTNYGTATDPNYYLAQWNSSRALQPSASQSGGGNAATTSQPTTWYSGTIDASLPSYYDWNVSVALSGTGWSESYMVWSYYMTFSDYNNVGTIFLQQGIGSYSVFDTLDTYSCPQNVTAVSIKPGTAGKILWTDTDIAPIDGNNSRYLDTWDPQAGVFIMRDYNLCNIYGYSITTGKLLWGPVSLFTASNPQSDFVFLEPTSETCYDGMVYVSGYQGTIQAFNETNGHLEWIYGDGGSGNSTYHGGDGPFAYEQIFVGTADDGKIYASSVDHSPTSPLESYYELRCLNATTGREIWTIYDYGTLMYGTSMPVADGIMCTLNNYDSQIYAIGKGPSQTTVAAPNVGVTTATGITISGTVMDTSAGTKQAEQAADFPNGIPCVSDASESAWMEYVYEQQPRPTNVTGVQVQISIKDSNDNTRVIGTATTDASGTYALSWIPDITGNFTVYANFAGTNSYYSSSAETHFYAGSPTPALAPTSPPINGLASTSTLMLAVAAIIVVMITGIVAIALMINRKRP